MALTGDTVRVPLKKECGALLRDNAKAGQIGMIRRFPFPAPLTLPFPNVAPVLPGYPRHHAKHASRAGLHMTHTHKNNIR